MTLAVGCGSVTSAQTSQTAQPTQAASSQIQVAISPRSITLNPATRQQFTATVQGSSNSAVTWEASAGTISSDGIFVAPVAKSGTQITISATSVTDPTQRATSLATIEQPTKLAVTTSSLSGVVVNAEYNAGLAATGGTPPYQWTVSGGSLPSGIQLQGASGTIAGTTSQPGTYSFTAKVTDSASNSATQSLALAVSQSSNSNFDGPAELPRVYLNTTLADTPAPGSTINVSAGGDLQAALNNANCGDTIAIQAGATFVLHQYTLPAKACDDQHWIIVRTSAPDASLPPEGTRMTPCYAGISSLPGRPPFSCPSTKKVLATISYPDTGDGPLIFANGANHYRLLGLEITRIANNRVPVTALVAGETGGAMSQIVLDRLYIHGSPRDETRRGVDFSGGTSMAVQDSYISDLHCNAGGTCIDSQAVSGGSGSLPMGPFKIDDNFLEAAGENIIFGGGAATHTPADIEIRFNHLFKPMFWLQGQAGFVAPAFVVKNHFELKNAQRVLFDSNVLDNTWGGFTQHGFSVLITPKNQASGDRNVCPICQVTDVTIRYTTISHVGGAFVIGNGLSDAGGAALAGERYSIHDVIVDDIDRSTYNGYGTFAQVSTLTRPLLQDVEINHVTAFPDHTMFSIGAPDTVQVPGFIFTNSIVTAGLAPVATTGNGGKSDCAYYDIPVKTVRLCFSGYKFSSNAILASPYPSSSWPSSNSFYSTTGIDFVNYNNGNGGDYHLLPSSPAIGAANDGTNLGANVDAVLSAVSGVQ